MEAREAACSFCGAGAGDVEHLIAGPGVWICDGCVRVSYEIIEGLDKKTTPPGASLSVDDPVMATIAQVQQLALQGERYQAADAFGELWEQVTDGRPLHRIMVAHYLADLQEDAADELTWDMRALEAASEVGEEHPDADEVAPLRASLHVNAAAALAELGRAEEANEQLEAAEGSLEALPPEGYGRSVRAYISALRSSLDNQPQLPL